jgi:hypothetical protein
MAHEKPKLLILNPLDWGDFKAEHNYSLSWVYKSSLTCMAFLQAWYCPFFFFLWTLTCMYSANQNACSGRWMIPGLMNPNIWYSNLRYSVNQVLANSNLINHLKKDKIQHLTCKWSRTMRWSSFAVPQMTFNTRFTPCKWRRN